MLPTLLPFLLFAFVASITPGPTNILVLSNSARYGVRAALPIVIGACAGAAGLVLVVGTGLGHSLLALPYAQVLMSWVGIGWMSWLSWKIYSSPVNPINASDERRLGMIGAAGLQLINPKTWMMALAVISVFSIGALDTNQRIVWLSLTFFLVSIPCMTCWALMGAGSARLLRTPLAMRRFNRSMAVLLLASAWLSLLAHH